MSDEHWSCKNLRLSIRQEPGLVWLKLAEPLTMREVEVKCEVGESTELSRTYHVREAIVIGMRRLMFGALDGGLVRISVSSSLGALSTSNKKAPLVKWEPREEEDTGFLIPPDA
jgi:hypothetical protein